MYWHLTLCTEWSVGTENGANAYFKTLLPFCPRHIIENVQILFTNMQLFALQDFNHLDYLWIIVILFLSVVWTLILTAPIHCRGSIGEQVTQCKIYSNLFQ